MNISICFLKTHSKWVKMLLSLLLGILASAVVAQEPIPETATDVPTRSLEITTDSGRQEVVEIMGKTSCCPRERQTVITRTRCGLRRPVRVSENDEIWLVSGRGSHLAPCDLDGLKIRKLCQGRWVESCLNELVCQHATDKSRVTMIYVHGNRTDLAWARSRGIQFYDNALQKCCFDRPPVRYVIFAWKSEMERIRLYPDYRIKSKRSVRMGTAFGNFLCQFEDRNMLIGGFSLGSQIVMQGLSNPGLRNQNDPLAKFEVAVIAPALDPDYVSCRLVCYPCNPTVEKTDVFLNRHDRAVGLAQRIVRNRSTGSTTSIEQLADQSANAPNSIRICDITDEVCRKHSVINYARSVTLRRTLATMLNSIYRTNSSVQDERSPNDFAGENVAVPSK